MRPRLRESRAAGVPEVDDDDDHELTPVLSTFSKSDDSTLPRFAARNDATGAADHFRLPRALRFLLPCVRRVWEFVKRRRLILCISIPVLYVAIIGTMTFVQYILYMHLPTGSNFMDRIVLFSTVNPKIPKSAGVELHAIREFSRVCCDYAATLYRSPVAWERKYKKFGFGERAQYDYAVARREFEKSSLTMARVFVPIAMLNSFIDDFFIPLPNDRQVVLVTGQEDCGPSEVFGYGRGECNLAASLNMLEFLGDPRLKAWFCQNYDVVDCEKNSLKGPDCQNPPLSPAMLKKIVPIPIGLDYHSAAERFIFDRTPPAVQEKTLVESVVVPWEERPLLALAAFSYESGKPDRMMLWNQLKGKEACQLPRRSMSREVFWQTHNSATFVFSPQGHGLDCHRIYEALNLHTVPVVRSSPLDSLYQQFPIIIVSNWTDFDSCDRLEEWRNEIINRFGPSPFARPEVMERLRLDYWTEVVQRAAEA